MQENRQGDSHSLTRPIMPVVFTAISAFVLTAISAVASASDNDTNAGAFCECNTPDAFPLIVQDSLNPLVLKIKEDFQTLDPRRHIDRTNPRLKPLDAIGQVALDLNTKGKNPRFGTGVLVYDDLVLTNAHVSQ